MKYSVWNIDRRVYDVYDGPGPHGTHAGSPRARVRSDLGATPDGAAWKLPSSAVKVGESDVPIGRIAAMPHALPMGDVDLPTLGIYAGIAYLAWRALR